MNKGIEVRAIRDWPRNGIGIFVEEYKTGKKFALKNLIIEEVEHAPWKVEIPPININLNSAQQLMDDLWQCGLRPSEGTGSAGQLAAVQQHLADMRQIAFKKMGVKKP